MISFEKDSLKKAFAAKPHLLRRYKNLFDRGADRAAMKLAKDEEELVALMNLPEFATQFSALFDIRLQQLGQSLGSASRRSLVNNFKSSASATLGRLKTEAEKRKRVVLKKEPAFRPGVA